MRVNHLFCFSEVVKEFLSQLPGESKKVSAFGCLLHKNYGADIQY